METLKKYGLTQDEIDELKGIKKDGVLEKKKVQKDLQEALDEMQMATRGDNNTSSETSSEEDPEN